MVKIEIEKTADGRYMMRGPFKLSDVAVREALAEKLKENMGLPGKTNLTVSKEEVKEEKKEGIIEKIVKKVGRKKKEKKE